MRHTDTSVVTIERFIIEQEKLHPEATGELSGVLYDMALAAKMIANKVRSAGLADVLGATDDVNVQGEVQEKLDVIANEIIIKAVDHGGRLCAMASEEEPAIIHIPERFRCGKYCLLFDPLDGSSNID
ncbi:MAG: class 1 fructose-bisphosphatase, partial [Gemmatimonadales bacterium]